MATVSQAYDAVRARLEAQLVGTTLYWQNENNYLPDTPTRFVYVEFLTGSAFIVGIGGGEANNRYRNPAMVEAYAFVPNGEGLKSATDLAEQVAAALRSYNNGTIRCIEATVMPGGDGSDLKPSGMDSEVGNYFYATASVSLSFDQIG